jgi:plasmid stabilization system protein ParE
LKRFELSRLGVRDIREIWAFISQHDFDAADRVVEDFYRTFGQLANTPGLGHSYLVVYKTQSRFASFGRLRPERCEDASQERLTPSAVAWVVEFPFPPARAALRPN